MSQVYQFYNTDISYPLTAANNLPGWEYSTLGQLYEASGKRIFAHELEGDARYADYAWRIVGAELSPEDSLMTMFHAYGLDGQYLAGARFGIAGGHKYQIAGGFKYPSKHGNRLFVPRKNEIVTVGGGQAVQVLDELNPSESLNFCFIGAEYHQCLDISFALMKIGPGYPNDVP